jgi:hypothetical protein
MATKLTEGRLDHRGDPLPEGVYALVNPEGQVVSYKSGWREHDDHGALRQRSKSFSRAQHGTLETARAAAIAHRQGALEIVQAGDTVRRADKAARLTLGDLFKEWIANHAAPATGERYARDSVRTWDQHMEPRLGRVRLSAIADDPGIVVRLHEELQRAGLAISARRKSLVLLRAVLRWGRRRHPRILTADVTALFEIASSKRRRLCRATDPLAVERLIEAVLSRRNRDPLGPVRDTALVRRSYAFGSSGLKTGARVALIAYRKALEARFGEQPANALVFQALSSHGALWYEDGFPVEWSDDDYKRWTARVWRPARTVAARAPDADNWIADLTFYELRHSAISAALHSTLVMTKDGMNLHTLAAYAGHDVQPCSATTPT